MKKLIILILLFGVNSWAVAQRKNPHNHQINIQDSILIDYLKNLDSTIENVNDTLLIESQVEIPSLKRVKVKYVPNSSVYVWNRGTNYLTLSKEINWESDSSLCVSINLHKNILKYDKKKREPKSLSSPTITDVTNYYVTYSCAANSWELQDRNKINSKYAYRNESNWVVMDSTSVRQFINSLRNPKQGRYIINSITTVGQVDRSWINKNDLEYLISIINSKEKSACIVQSISSQRADWADISTIGAQVTQILFCYMKNEPYPNSLNYCPSENEAMKKEILNWWNELEK